MRAESTVYRPRARQRQSTRRIALRRAVLLAAVVALLAVLVGFAFAGSQSALAAGTTVAGVDVGGLSRGEAVRLLSARATAVERAPITFTAAGESYALSASQLGVSADWEAAVGEAAAAGGGFGPVRGDKRIQARIFGIDAVPPVTAYDAAVDYKLDQIAKAVSRGGVDAKLVRKGLDVQIVEGQAGRKLDQRAAARLIVQSLARLRPGCAGRSPARRRRCPASTQPISRELRRRHASHSPRRSVSPTARRDGESHDGRSRPSSNCRLQERPT